MTSEDNVFQISSAPKDYSTSSTSSQLTMTTPIEYSISTDLVAKKQEKYSNPINLDSLLMPPPPSQKRAKTESNICHQGHCSSCGLNHTDHHEVKSVEVPHTPDNDLGTHFDVSSGKGDLVGPTERDIQTETETSASWRMHQSKALSTTRNEEIVCDHTANISRDHGNHSILKTRFSDIIGHGAAKLRLDEMLLPLALPMELSKSIFTGKFKRTIRNK